MGIFAFLGEERKAHDPYAAVVPAIKIWLKLAGCSLEVGRFADVCCFRSERVPFNGDEVLLLILAGDVCGARDVVDRVSRATIRRFITNKFRETFGQGAIS